MNTSEILQTANSILSEREATHGNHTQNFKRISQMWSAYLSMNITPSDVANMMVLLKVSRIASGNANIDNYVDICGYASISGVLSSAESRLK